MKKLLFGACIMHACTICSIPVNSQTPSITPVWALGHIIWEDSINTKEGALSLVESYRSRDIEVNGIIIDSPWSTSYNDFNWDNDRYPQPEDMLLSLKNQNVNVLLWMTGNLNSICTDVPIQKTELYDYAVEHGYCINNNIPSTWWKGEGMYVDFTNPEAVNWWYEQLDKVFCCDGVLGFKVDQGEIVYGDSIESSLGKISQFDFRKYYYDAMYDYVVSRKPGIGITYARPYSHQGEGFFASIDKLGIGWCGDFQGNYAGLKLQIENIYKSALAGYGAVGCEIGGFNGRKSTKEELIRYTQFAAMTGCMINGGG